MAKSSAVNAGPGGKSGIRIVVAGDRGTGKSSLICTAATDQFPANVPPLLPPTGWPEDFDPDGVPITIIDTSSRVEDSVNLGEELRKADAVVLTYACEQPSTLERLSSFWLPELRRLEVKVPVIVVGCKLDLIDELQKISLESVMSPIMRTFREIETCIECSAYEQIQIPEVFYYAQKSVLHPTAPLFDQESQTLKPRCVRALKRIFVICDRDKDGALSDAELNECQVKCFNAPLQHSEIVWVERVVQEKLPQGVNDRGLTLTGFLFLHASFIERGRLETTWTVLRKFGYDNDIKLSEDLIPISSLKRSPDQTVELTHDAIEFLKGIFKLFDSDGDGALRPHEIEDIFSTAPECPWDEAPYKDAAERTELGGLSLNGFLSLWALMTLLEPARTLENLMYLGYADASLGIHVTRTRRQNRRKRQTDRNVFHCFVFGPKRAGKSALLNSFLRRPFADAYNTTTDERYAVNVVEKHFVKGTKKTVVLREIPEDKARNLLSRKESLADCDLAIFVHDSSDESSRKRATELLVEVASHGEVTGFEVPCLIIAAKDDLGPFPMATKDSTRVSRDLGIEAPIPISVRWGVFNNLFRRIVGAAEHPHLRIPETESGRSRKQYHKLVNRSLMFVSVGAAVAIVGLAAYRVYAARKNSSS